MMACPAIPIHAPRPARDIARGGSGGGVTGGGALWRVWESLGRDNISIMAAGTAYYLILSIVPGMSALVLTYGLVANPVLIERHIDALSGVMPAEALKLVSDRASRPGHARPRKSSGLGWWSAS